MRQATDGDWYVWQQKTLSTGVIAYVLPVMLKRKHQQKSIDLLHSLIELKAAFQQLSDQHDILQRKLNVKRALAAGSSAEESLESHAKELEQEISKDKKHVAMHDALILTLWQQSHT